VKRFWRRGFDTHISGKWLFIIVLIPMLVSAVPLGAYLMSGGIPPELSVLSQPWMILPIFLTYFFTGGGNEEWGWRGFALDRLQLRWSPLVASLILGVIWGLWHLPLFFIAYTGQFHMSLAAFLLAAPALSVLHTWVYNGSGRNLLAAWLFHAALGTVWEVFPIVQPQLAGYENIHRYDFLAIVIVALVVVAVRGSRLGEQELVHVA
jgi:hypothetical protein